MKTNLSGTIRMCYVLSYKAHPSINLTPLILYVLLCVGWGCVVDVGVRGRKKCECEVWMLM
jgi:hypothetical protein